MSASGRWGAVSVGGVLSSIGQWGVSKTADTKAFAASNTKSGTGRRAGNLDWNGSFQQQSGFPSVLPGDTGTFIGLIAPAGDAQGAAGLGKTGSFICDSVQIVWNWMTNEIVRSTVNISGNGLLTNISNADLVDASQSLAVPSSLCAMQIVKHDTVSYVNGCFQQATLTMARANKPFANSCTSGSINRRIGNLDWSLVLQSDVEDTATGWDFDENDYVKIKAYIDDEQFWLLEYGLVRAFENFNVNVETGDISRYSIAIDMSGDTGPGTDFDGQIVKPDVSVMWPVALV
jgi:hypothetical protein